MKGDTPIELPCHLGGCVGWANSSAYLGTWFPSNEWASSLPRDWGEEYPSLSPCTPQVSTFTYVAAEELVFPDKQRKWSLPCLASDVMRSDQSLASPLVVGSGLSSHTQLKTWLPIWEQRQEGAGSSVEAGLPGPGRHLIFSRWQWARQGPFLFQLQQPRSEG